MPEATRWPLSEPFRARGEAFERAGGAFAACAGPVEAAGEQFGPLPRPGRAFAEQAAGGGGFAEAAADLRDRAGGLAQAGSEAGELGGRGASRRVQFAAERAQGPGGGGDRGGADHGVDAGEARRCDAGWPRAARGAGAR